MEEAAAYVKFYAVPIYNEITHEYSSKCTNKHHAYASIPHVCLKKAKLQRSLNI